MFTKNTLIFSAALLCLAISGCGHDPKAPVKTDNNCINDTMMLNISIDTVKQLTVQREMKLTGKITFNEDKTSKVYPLASGRVADVKVELGDYVQKGQVLAVIQSSEAADFENELSAAESKMVIAEKNLNVAKDMYEDGLTSQKEYTSAQKEYQIAQAELNKIKEVLKIYNISGTATYTVHSPIAGFVVEKKVIPDFYIRSDNNENIFTISDIDDVWVLANLYETDIAKVVVGDEVEVTTLGYKDKVYKGIIDKIFNVVDPLTKSLKARIKLHNPDYTLKPEMFANVSVFFAENKDLPSIPSNAVIFDNNRNYVLVFKDACHVETREVVPYRDFRKTTYISSGLAVGERVISRSQLLIYNQINN